MLHGRRSLPKDNIVSLERYDRGAQTTQYDNKGPYVIHELEYLKYRLSLGSGVCFPFITDTHPTPLGQGDTNYGWNSTQKNFSIFEKTNTKNGGVYVYNSKFNLDALERSTAVLIKLAETNRMDCCVIGGDYEAGTIAKESYIALAEEQAGILRKISNRMPVLMIKGNHDLNGLGTDTTSDRISRMVTTQEYANAVNGDLLFNSNVVYDTDEYLDIDNDGNVERVYPKTYGYYDIPDEKVRVAFLNIYDYGNYNSSSAEWLASKSGGNEHSAQTFIGEKQLKFICNHILKFNENQVGWNILLCAHAPFLHTTMNISGTDYEKEVFRIFASFQHGFGETTFPSFDITNTNDSQFQINSFTYDFSDNTGARNNKIFCMISGHTHDSKLYNAPYVINSTSVTSFHSTSSSGTHYITCISVESHGQPTGETGVRDYNPNGASRNGVTMEATFDIIQFAPSDNKIYCHRYGLGESRIYTRASNGALSLESRELTVVVEDENGNAISGATVVATLNGGSAQKTTDANGSALFTKWPKDKCTITVTASGYNNETVPPIDTNQETDINITLTENE